MTQCAQRSAATSGRLAAELSCATSGWLAAEQLPSYLGPARSGTLSVTSGQLAAELSFVFVGWSKHASEIASRS